MDKKTACDPDKNLSSNDETKCSVKKGEKPQSTVAKDVIETDSCPEKSKENVKQENKSVPVPEVTASSNSTDQVDNSINKKSGRTSSDQKEKIKGIPQKTTSKNEEKSKKPRKKMSVKKRTSVMLEQEFQKKKSKYVDELAILPIPLRRLYSTVPKPKEAEIENGLPSWNNGPLDTKLFIIQSPEDNFVCTRGKIGEKLWKSFEGGTFSYYDPYGYEISIPYDSLHDKHLKRFFHKRINVVNLQKLNLVTDKDDAKCSLKEYNSYRRYLYNVYAESLKIAFNEKEMKETEERDVNKAIINIHKELITQQVNDIINQRLKVVEAQRELTRQEKEMKCMRRLARVQKVLQNNERKKEELICEAGKRHDEFKNRIHQRVMVAAEIEHKRKTDSLLQRLNDDRQFKLTREQDRLLKKIEKEKKIESRWERKIRNQNLQIKRENELRDKRANDLNEKANKRLERNLRQLKLRESRLTELKATLVQEQERKYYTNKRPKVHFIEEKKHDYARNIPRTIVNLVERFRAVHGYGDFSVSAHKEEKRVPHEVKDVITDLLHQSVKIYIRSKVEIFVNKLVSDTIVLYDEQVSIWRKKKVSHLLEKRHSLLAELSCIHTKDVQKVVEEQVLILQQFSEEPARQESTTSPLVSFGQTETVAESEIFDPEVRSVKDREVTPVNSDYVIEEVPAVEVSYTSISPHLPEKGKLLTIIDYLCKSVLSSLETKIVSSFFDTGGVFSLTEILDIESKGNNLIEYIFSTFVNVVESTEEIDEDECVSEVTRYIAKHILSV